MKLISYKEMPDFEIYSDQLISIVNQQLAFLNSEVTNAMINNYVKQKLMPLPTKKKYHKIHIARLLMISLLKSVYSIDEIKQYFTYYPETENYDCFCTIFEKLRENDTSLEPDKLSEIDRLHYYFAGSVISKLKATSLLKQKGENHAKSSS